jgi:hypothetical protein
MRTRGTTLGLLFRRLWVRQIVGAAVSSACASTNASNIEEGNSVYTSDGRTRASVLVVTPQYGAKYLRTYADGTWTNNLLALPRF